MKKKSSQPSDEVSAFAAFHRAYQASLENAGPREEPAKESAAFPPEFLDCFLENAFQTLRAHLEKAGAHSQAVILLDCIQGLESHAKDIQAGGMILQSTNRAMVENIADASRCIVDLGGVFYAPSGASIPRECAS